MIEDEDFMFQFRCAWTKFGRSTSGASVVEYGLLLSLIAVVCILAIAALGTTISDMLSDLASQI
jgi:pilus assembly protein Flp/PilA